MAKSKDVTTKGSSSTAIATVPDYGDDSGAGFENLSAKDYAVPFIGILQGLSPQCTEGDPGYVEGARPGEIFNTVTQKRTNGKDGIAFIPVHTSHQFVEWVPRKQGGGFKGSHAPDSKVVRDAIARDATAYPLLTETGNELRESYYVFGLLVPEEGDEEAPQQVIVSFGATGLKDFKKWMTRARLITITKEDGRRITPPLFAHVWRLRSQTRKNAKGSWYAWSPEFDGDDAAACRLDPSSMLFQMAKSFREMAVSGLARASEEGLTEVYESPDGSSDEADGDVDASM